MLQAAYNGAYSHWYMTGIRERDNSGHQTVFCMNYMGEVTVWLQNFLAHPKALNCKYYS